MKAFICSKRNIKVNSTSENTIDNESLPKDELQKISDFRRYHKNKKKFINFKNNFEVIFGRYAQRSSKTLFDIYPNLKINSR